MYDFVIAALPWIILGVCIAIFAVKSSRKDQQDEEKTEDHSSIGMSIGVCAGITLSSMLLWDRGLCTSLGMLVG